MNAHYICPFQGWNNTMRASKSLTYLGLGAIGLGVGYDVAAAAGAISGDGQDHTVSRVPSGLSTATDASVSTIICVNYSTGEEFRVAPRDHSPRVVQYPHR